MFSPRVVKIFKTHLLTITTVLGVLLSIIVGLSMRFTYEGVYSPRTVMYVNFLGDLFLRMIRAIILPLIVSSLIAAIAPLDVSLSKKIGVRAIVYILSTTIIAVILGIVLVLTIKPGGKGIDDGTSPGEKTQKASTIVDTLLDLIRSVLLFE
jgi:Na+/H+-dicarboxylate symporter